MEGQQKRVVKSRRMDSCLRLFFEVLELPAMVMNAYVMAVNGR